MFRHFKFCSVIGVLALFVGLTTLGTTGAKAAPLQSQCTSYPRADVHLYGPSTVTNSTDVNYTIVVRNVSCKTLRHLRANTNASLIVVSSQPAGLENGKIALKNLRPRAKLTIKVVVNFPSSMAGQTPPLIAYIYFGVRGGSVAHKYVHVN